jgi:hypothetical protein
MELHHSAKDVNEQFILARCQALGMNDIQNIITERVDDIPLLLEHMQRMELPTLIDSHFPAHGNWDGLSLGWVITIWLSSILSRGDHRLVHVEPGVLVKRGQLTRPSFGVLQTFETSRVPGPLPIAVTPRCPQAQSLALGMYLLLPQA